MDEFLRYEQLLAPVVSILMTVVIVPLISRLYRLHREQAHMIKRKLFENTGVVIFGVFDGKMQSDYLGGFLTTLFGETLFELIVEWNDEPSPNIIIPQNEHQSAHMVEILAAHASPYILQSRRIDCYFDGAEEHGTKSYKFCKFVVGLARPDADKLACHDYPRVIMIEAGHLKQLMEDDTILPQFQTTDGVTWLETVRELGTRYLNGEKGIAVLEIPLVPKA